MKTIIYSFMVHSVCAFLLLAQSAAFGTETVGLYNATSSQFYLKNRHAGGAADVSFAFGPRRNRWLPISGDWDSDDRDTVGLFNSTTSQFYLQNAHQGGRANVSFGFGPRRSGWLPLSGDWNGDGRDTVGLYDPVNSRFYLKNRLAGGRANVSFAFGPRNLGWLPLSGDWDIDGRDTVGLFNPATSQFYLQNAHQGGAAEISFTFGPRAKNWLPLSGDWDFSNLVDLCMEKTTCGEMASCTEARFYLEQCGLIRLDGDRDGIPCENLCLSPPEPPQPPPQPPKPPTLPPQPPYTCGEKTTCGQMSSCEEANFYLQQCGLTRLDRDRDGVPCESLCRSAPEQVERTGNGHLLRLDRTGFTIWLDCAKRGAVRFRYNAQRDTGDFPRHGSFYRDPEVPAACQQTSTASYRRPPGAKPTYDRGHLVPANHLDYSKAAIRQTNTMINILPQVSQMNRGAWLQTEEIIECYRDLDELLVIGGVIWGDNPDDDFFLSSHGIATPAAFWKVIVREDRVIAWMIPNAAEATRQRLDNYLVTVASLEKLTGVSIPVADYLKQEMPETSWLIPIGCDRG